MSRYTQQWCKSKYGVVGIIMSLFSTAPDDYLAFSETRSISNTTANYRQCFDVMVVADDEREHPGKLLVTGSALRGDLHFNPAQTEVWIIDGCKEYSVLQNDLVKSITSLLPSYPI